MPRTSCSSLQSVRPVPEEYHARADAALESFLLKFWSQGASYLKAHYPDNGSATGYWTFAQGFDAVLDGVERTEGKAYAGWIETLFDAQNQRGLDRRLLRRRELDGACAPPRPRPDG
jgi:hypothetical protein